MTPLETLANLKQVLLILAPELIVLAMATIIMTAGAFVKRSRRTWAIVSVVALVAALVMLCLLRDQSVVAFASVAVNDSFGWYGRLGFVLTGLVLLALAHDQVDENRAPEFFGAFLMVHAGAMLAASANELIFLFIALELVSIPTYLLLYLPKRNPLTQESATKYFYLSIFSSAFFLFGLAYLYGAFGTTNIQALSFLSHWHDGALGTPNRPLALVAVVFILAGLGFRVAAVPFHFYAPDVYQGSPTVLAAFLAWVPKAVGFFAILRLLTTTLGSTLAPGTFPDEIASRSMWVAWIIAVATMTLGNTVALAQSNLKRLFAYSSIAHAGYMMVGVAAAFRNGPNTSEADFTGAAGVLFYLATYALMTLGAFAVIIALSNSERQLETIDDLSGLAWTHPGPAIALGLCLFSLAGVPPLAGFWGKFQVFGAALTVARDGEANTFYTLAIIAGLNAAIGAYYYLRIVVLMVFGSTDRPLVVKRSWPHVIAFGACAGLSLAVGFFPGPLSRAVRDSARSLMQGPDVPPVRESNVTEGGLYEPEVPVPVASALTLDRE